MIIEQIRDITMNDLVAFRHGVGEVLLALSDGRKTINNLTISDYIRNLEEKTGIRFRKKNVNIIYPRHQNKIPNNIM